MGRERQMDSKLDWGMLAVVVAACQLSQWPYRTLDKALEKPQRGIHSRQGRPWRFRRYGGAWRIGVGRESGPESIG